MKNKTDLIAIGVFVILLVALSAVMILKAFPPVTDTENMTHTTDFRYNPTQDNFTFDYSSGTGEFNAIW